MPRKSGMQEFRRNPEFRLFQFHKMNFLISSNVLPCMILVEGYFTFVKRNSLGTKYQNFPGAVPSRKALVAFFGRRFGKARLASLQNADQILFSTGLHINVLILSIDLWNS